MSINRKSSNWRLIFSDRKSSSGPTNFYFGKKLRKIIAFLCRALGYKLQMIVESCQRLFLIPVCNETRFN